MAAEMEPAPQLISDYLDGELNSAGIEELAGLLRRDATAVDQLVLGSFVHMQLFQWMNVRPMYDELLVAAFGAAKVSDRSVDSGSDHRNSEHFQKDSTIAAKQVLISQRKLHRSRGALAAISAALLIAASIAGTALYSNSQPAIVGQLTQGAKCKWEATSPNLPVGSLLHAGQQLSLTSGRALVTLSSGTQLVINGPAAVQILLANRVNLQQGRIGAKVPTQAIGFTVSTPCAHFVDLGTEFTLKLEANRTGELQVFDGLVELQLFGADKPRIKQRLRISEGSAVRFDPQRQDVVSVPYDEQQRVFP